jgi:hypothetical protein
VPGGDIIQKKKEVYTVNILKLDIKYQQQILLKVMQTCFMGDSKSRKEEKIIILSYTISL